MENKPALKIVFWYSNSSRRIVGPFVSRPNRWVHTFGIENVEGSEAFDKMDKKDQERIAYEVFEMWVKRGADKNSNIQQKSPNIITEKDTLKEIKTKQKSVVLFVKGVTRSQNYELEWYKRRQECLKLMSGELIRKSLNEPWILDHVQVMYSINKENDHSIIYTRGWPDDIQATTPFLSFQYTFENEKHVFTLTQTTGQQIEVYRNLDLENNIFDSNLFPALENELCRMWACEDIFKRFEPGTDGWEYFEMGPRILNLCENSSGGPKFQKVIVFIGDWAFETEKEMLNSTFKQLFNSKNSTTLRVRIQAGNNEKHREKVISVGTTHSPEVKCLVCGKQLCK